MRRLAGWLPLTASIAALAAEVSIDEWDVPTENSRPHDPAVAPDGALWFTEQRANKLGRLDPRTGQMKEFPLPTPGSGPHGLVADREGNIWFTAISKGYVGKLDPKTGSVKEYPTRDRRARDPHTPVFDQRGRLWFTLEQSNFIGRLDPRNSEMRLAEVPTQDAVPYGIAVTPGRALFLRVRQQQACEHRSRKHEDRGILPTRRRSTAPSCHRSRRHDLLQRLRARPARPIRSCVAKGRGVAVARRGRRQAVRDRGHA